MTPKRNRPAPRSKRKSNGADRPAPQSRKISMRPYYGLTSAQACAALGYASRQAMLQGCPIVSIGKCEPFGAHNPLYDVVWIKSLQEKRRAAGAECAEIEDLF